MNARIPTALKAIWLMCGLGATVVGVLVLIEHGHPLAEREPGSVWLLHCLPLILIAAASGFLLRRRATLIAVAVVAGVVAFLAAVACYQDLQTTLSILDSRAAGRHGMNCGPPLIFFVLPATYGAAFLVVAMGFGLLPVQGERRGVSTP